MGYNLLNLGGSFLTSNECIYDSNLGYSADFSVNGNVDYWAYYKGIHTYGCWNNFLFGTLYGDSALVGRSSTFIPVDAEYFYLVRITMKLNFIEREGIHEYPTYGRLRWRTLSDDQWNSDKQKDFELHNDSEWHVYEINMSGAQWWQGQINDLRIYPILNGGLEGDEFFIRGVDIASVHTYRCTNPNCSYYTQYTHPCPGVGERGYCKSQPPNLVFTDGDTVDDLKYSIEKDVNDLLLLNINGYGYENVVIQPVMNCSGNYLANIISKEIAKLDVGGYAENIVEFNAEGQFLIYSGVYAADSTVVVGDSPLARYLNFYSSSGQAVSTAYVGSYPVDGFKPKSSFKAKTSQIYAMLDDDNNSGILFNPFIYNVEGGVRDWLAVGLGKPSKSVAGGAEDKSHILTRIYNTIDNAGKTIIDFNHPFNASGRIKKIFAAVTLDDFSSGSYRERGVEDEYRIASQLTDAKVLFFRPLKDGSLKVLDIEVPIENRAYEDGKLYSASQEYIEIDCDIFVNKGDLIGIYNANIYIGRSFTGEEVDATYYQFTGKSSGVIELTTPPKGDGSLGLLIYARSDQIQNQLVLNIDLGKRVNIENVNIIGESKEPFLDYNIARCLDIDWNVDLFGGDHTTGRIRSYSPLVKGYRNHPNIAYGEDCLTDGITVVSDGLAADGFSIEYGAEYISYNAAVGKKDGGRGVIPSNPKYFFVNGDEEWLGTYWLPYDVYMEPYVMPDFENDPIAFTLYFPNQKDKLVYKSKIYFKERYNFRSFGLSLYKGENHVGGDADDTRFDYIPNRVGYQTPWVEITLDGSSYTPDSVSWDSLEKYLGPNPCIGHAVVRTTSVDQYEIDKYMAHWDSLDGLVYSAGAVIENYDSFLQASKIDWTILEHKWEPTYAKGFRFYCNNHNSTKICEFEVYCAVGGSLSALGGAIDLRYSFYNESWILADSSETVDGVVANINDTPRYINITLRPLVETHLYNLDLTVSKEDVFMGDKGCEYSVIPAETRRGTSSSSEVINFKNVYGANYDLYVDIEKDSLVDAGLVFFSTMEDEVAITNPEVGADSYYIKNQDYSLVNYQKNVAINCPVYSLNNLMADVNIWYSHDNKITWNFWGNVSSGKDLDLTNLPNTTITTLNTPSPVSCKWWKMGFSDKRINTKVKELRLYYNDQEIEDVVFYHHKNEDVNNTPNTDTAPHLNNDIVDGSYYVLNGGENYIGFELTSIKTFDKIVIYHDKLEEYEVSQRIAGIDSSTALYIAGIGDLYQKDSIVDESYYEHPIQVVGSGIYCDTTHNSILFSFVEDFSGFPEDYIDTFSSSIIDTTVWANPVNTSIVAGALCVTNSGTIGQVETLDYLSGNFSVSVDLDIVGAMTTFGWGCYLEAFTDAGPVVRVGKLCNVAYSRYEFVSKEFSQSLSNIDYVIDAATSNLKLKLERADSVTYCYATSVSGTWESLGSSDVLGDYDVKFRLISDHVGIVSEITTAKFDNFKISGFNDNNWVIRTAYDSTFTTASGVSPVDTVCNLDLVGKDAVYRMADVFDDYNNKPIDQDFSFTLEFVVKPDVFLNTTGGSYNDRGFFVGIYDYYRWWRAGWYPGNYVVKTEFVGVGLFFSRSYVGLSVAPDIGSNYPNVVTYDLVTEGNIYYCRLSYDGYGNYEAILWDDGFDGLNQVATMSVESSIVKWKANKVGLSGYSASCNVVGWISDFNFSCVKATPHYKVNNSSIKFSGYDNEYLSIDYNSASNCDIAKDGFHFATKRFTFDFFIEFNTVPKVGQRVILAACWDEAELVALDSYWAVGSATVNNSSWALTIEREETFLFRLYISDNGVVRCLKSFNYFSPDPHRIYYICVCRNPGSRDNDIYNELTMFVDGYTIFPEVYNFAVSYNTVDKSTSNIIVGKNLDGWLEDFRISSDYSLGGAKAYEVKNFSYPIDNYYGTYNDRNYFHTEKFERYYTFSFFTSEDNIYYGKLMDVDVLYDNNHSVRLPFSEWSTEYYTYFAVDLKQRYNLEIIRSYPIDTSFNISLTDNVLYSNKDVSSPKIAFTLTEDELNLDEGFSGINGSFPSGWVDLSTENTSSYLINDMFYQICNDSNEQTYCKVQPDFYFLDEFDFYIDYDFGGAPPTTESWRAQLRIDDLIDSKNGIILERSYYGGNKYNVWVKDDDDSWVLKFIKSVSTERGTMRVERSGQLFRFYTKTIEQPYSSFELIFTYEVAHAFNRELQFSLCLVSDATIYPKIEVWWDNFIVTKGDPVYNTADDTRWVCAKMLNGDGTERTINNLDIYPRVSSKSNAVNQYNTSWTALGSAVTSYAEASNIALGATVSGSSAFGYMVFDNITNGIVPDGSLDQCWGSDSGEVFPWVTIDLGAEKQIFRVKIWHGYSEADDTIMNVDYNIQISSDDYNYITIFNITNNSSHERVHDLLLPVFARYVKINITAYDTVNTFTHKFGDGDYVFWEGAVLREVEIYEYYGFTNINSEDNPIIAIDLNNRYFIDGHDVVGFYSEYSDRDWSNDDSNFAWSNSNLNDPQKVNFGEWGSTPGYEKWVVLKRNTATHYPAVPVPTHLNTDTPDYLKHVIIMGSSDGVGGAKPNPIAYPWMWNSNVSVLSSDYSLYPGDKSIYRYLKVDYPPSTQADHIRFIEGDHFGWDERVSWRDGFSFYLHIDDVDNLDITYGYFYLGGYDYTHAENPVVHIWNLVTFGNSLQTGWNLIFLKFKDADVINYTDVSEFDNRDPRILYSIKFGSVGFLFKGVGNSLSLKIGGLYIKRNHFRETCNDDATGLYLHSNECLRLPISEFDFNKGTIEFFIKPDWDFVSEDIYNDGKVRNLFHFNNIANDVLGAAITYNGFQIYYGNLLDNFNTATIFDLQDNVIDKCFHMAIVFSCDGTHISSDNSTIRLYINNQLFVSMYDTWTVSEYKHFNLLFGGHGLIGQRQNTGTLEASSVDAVISRLKVHNFCKTDFSDRFGDVNNYTRVLSKPNRFIEISSNNITFYNTESGQLPLVFKDVSPGESVPIYFKVNLPRYLVGSEKRTARIIGSWDIGV